MGVERRDSSGGSESNESRRLVGLRLGGDRGQQGESDDRAVKDSGVEGEGREDPEQMAAVTRHHLAVVVHAQVGGGCCCAN